MTLNFVKLSVDTLKILCNNDKYNDEYILVEYRDGFLELLQIRVINNDYYFYIDEYEDNDITFYMLKNKKIV